MMSSATPEQRLEELGFVLPPPAAAVPISARAITGNPYDLGQPALARRQLAYPGKNGHELSGEDGYKCCQLRASMHAHCAMGG